MQSPVQIQFKNMGSSETVEAAINQWVDKLDRAYPPIITCPVSVEAPLEKKMRGGLYHTRIDKDQENSTITNLKHTRYADFFCCGRSCYDAAQMVPLETDNQLACSIPWVY